MFILFIVILLLESGLCHSNSTGTGLRCYSQTIASSVISPNVSKWESELHLQPFLPLPQLDSYKCFVRVMANGGAALVSYGMQSAGLCPPNDRCLRFADVDGSVCCCSGDLCNSDTFQKAVDNSKVAPTAPPTAATTSQAATVTPADGGLGIEFWLLIINSICLAIVSIICVLLSVCICRRRQKRKLKETNGEKQQQLSSKKSSTPTKTEGNSPWTPKTPRKPATPKSLTPAKSPTTAGSPKTPRMAGTSRSSMTPLMAETPKSLAMPQTPIEANTPRSTTDLTKTPFANNAEETYQLGEN